jgi:hypothetical protein
VTNDEIETLWPHVTDKYRANIILGDAVSTDSLNPKCMTEIEYGADFETSTSGMEYFRA